MWGPQSSEERSPTPLTRSSTVQHQATAALSSVASGVAMRQVQTPGTSAAPVSGAAQSQARPSSQAAERSERAVKKERSPSA